MSGYQYEHNQCSDELTSEQTVAFARIISYGIGHFLPGITVSVIDTTLHLDEGTSGTKFRLNVITHSDETGFDLITCFGSLKHINLKLKEVSGERAVMSADPWHFDKHKNCLSENDARNQISFQTKSASNHGNPRFANIAGAQIASCFGSDVTSSSHDDTSALPLITSDVLTPAAPGVPPLMTAWAGDW